MVEILIKFENCFIKIGKVNSILITKSIKSFFTLIMYGVGVCCNRGRFSVPSPFIEKSMMQHIRALTLMQCRISSTNSPHSSEREGVAMLSLRDNTLLEGVTKARGWKGAWVSSHTLHACVATKREFAAANGAFSYRLTTMSCSSYVAFTVLSYAMCMGRGKFF